MYQCNDSGFVCHQLDTECRFLTGRLPSGLELNPEAFESMWSTHPKDYHEIRIHGRLVKTPRWQQAYGVDYHYTNRTNQAIPLTPTLNQFLDWAKLTIDQNLNGVLVNWYDGKLSHYIGAHRDSRVNMVVDAPIVTISFGEPRTFRLRPWKGKGFRDFVTENGTVFIMPFETNKAWTHEVPHAAKFRGRRISITIRAFLTNAGENTLVRSIREPVEQFTRA